MRTEIIKLSGEKDKKNLEKISQTFRRGGLVVFPTETVYGLGANGLDPTACKNIYLAKGRPSDNPLILHIADKGQLKDLVSEIPESAKKCMGAFWPGPLTIIFRKSEKVPLEATGGLDTVAVRMPSHPIAHMILKDAGLPIAAPSANLSGRPSPTMTKHVLEDLSGKVDIIVDGGHTVVGIESTVLDVTVEPPMILRPGKVTLEQLQTVIADVSIDQTVIATDEKTIPKSPGQKYKHYAPKAQAYLFAGNLTNVVKEVNKRVQESCGKKTAVLGTTETIEDYRGMDVLINLGSREDLEEIAANLFDALRQCDEEKVDIIFVEGFELHGMGLSIMNRLLKACGGKVMLGL